jgi:hypothetical protein
MRDVSTVLGKIGSRERRRSHAMAVDMQSSMILAA